MAWDRDAWWAAEIREIEIDIMLHERQAREPTARRGETARGPGYQSSPYLNAKAMASAAYAEVMKTELAALSARKGNTS
jgi:hypothetical protein